MELAFAVDKWDMGWGTISLVCEGWGAEHAHVICAPFPLLCCPAHEKGEYKCQLRARMRGKVDYKEVESRWLKGGSCARRYIIISKVKIYY